MDQRTKWGIASTWRMAAMSEAVKPAGWRRIPQVLVGGRSFHDPEESPSIGVHSASCSALKRIDGPALRRVSSLVSPPLTKNYGFGRETVVLPTRAMRDEPAQRRSIGTPKESLATKSDESCVQGSETTEQFAPRQDREYLLHQ